MEEYEKTISEVISGRERDRVLHEIAKEKIEDQRDQVFRDLKSAEDAFNDVARWELRKISQKNI